MENDKLLIDLVNGQMLLFKKMAMMEKKIMELNDEKNQLKADTHPLDAEIAKLLEGYREFMEDNTFV